jgi:hypothetical protein
MAVGQGLGIRCARQEVEHVHDYFQSVGCGRHGRHGTCCAASSFLAASPEWVKSGSAKHVGGWLGSRPVYPNKRTTAMIYPEARALARRRAR